ncbi:MAG: hypothetical protein VCB77_11310, partial [Alphaproteobacteria bacterium]
YAWMGETDSDEDDNSSGMFDDESGDSESGQSESGDNESAGSDESGDSSEGKDDDENADDSGSNMASSDNSDCDTDDNSADADALKGSDEGGKDSSGKGSVPEATTDSAFGKAMDELRDKIAENRVYAKIPKVDWDEVTWREPTTIRLRGASPRAPFLIRSPDHVGGLGETDHGQRTAGIWQRRAS